MQDEKIANSSLGTKLHWYSFHQLSKNVQEYLNLGTKKLDKKEQKGGNGCKKRTSVKV